MYNDLMDCKEKFTGILKKEKINLRDIVLIAQYR